MENKHKLGKDTIRYPIANITTPRDVLAIPWQFQGGLTEAEFLRVGQVTQTMWRHDGDPARPHAMLASGLCSDGYFDVGGMLTYSNLCTILATQLLDRLKLSKGLVDWTIGSDHSAAALVHEIGRLTGSRCDFAHKEVEHQIMYDLEDHPYIAVKAEHQRWKREIESDAYVLRIEELVTTLTTTERVRFGVEDFHKRRVIYIPTLGTIVHRPDPDESNPTEFEGGRIVSVFFFPTNAWRPKECPLCKGGSKTLKPKTNWAELTAT